MAAVAHEWPPGHVRRLAERLEHSGPRSAGGSALERELVAAWTATTVTPGELAAALDAAAATAEHLRGEEGVDLVWTGPVTEEVPMRRTESVLAEVVGEAVRTVQVVNFVAYEVPSVSAALRDAVARGVEVSVVLEAPTTLGGRLDTDCVSAMRAAVPGATVYVWTEQEAGRRGVVHAKCAVADGRIALVTSANITDAALSRNMELGVLIRGGRLPARLARHLRALVDRRVLSPAE
ncbi:hypothetical protein GCM10008937_34060 [Deinococcus depolymerans]|uniref:PLD phosphodiesterase domain-containing protein n=1 Tax=Deinococcus depolymerans TaxID=392408 RepID=A0ABP3MNA4_9DEIO